MHITNSIIAHIRSRKKVLPTNMTGSAQRLFKAFSNHYT